MAERPSYRDAWRILLEVSARLREQEDQKGDLKNTGEARGLLKMKRELEREIAKDATEFLREHGINGWGLRKRGKRR